MLELDKIRPREKKIVESNKRNKILKDIDTIEEIKTASDKKRTKISTDKISKKYKYMKRPNKRGRYRNHRLY